MVGAVRVGLDSYSYRFAAGIWSYRPARPLTPKDYIDKAVEMGVAAVQFADVRHFANLEPAYLREIGAYARQRQIRLEFGTGGTAFERLREALKACEHLGCDLVRTFVGAKRWSDVPIRRQIEQAIADLKRAVPLAKDRGLRIVIENHQDLTSGELLQIIEGVGDPAVGVCLDTGNPLAVLEDPVEAAERLAPFTYTTHIKDYRVVRSAEGFRLVGCVLGQGDVDLVRVVEILRSASPVSGLCLNVESTLEDIPVRLLEPGFVEGFGEPKVADLRWLLRLLWREGEPVGPAWNEAPDEERLLELEDRQVRQSVKYLMRLVGQFSEDSEIGE